MQAHYFNRNLESSRDVSGPGLTETSGFYIEQCLTIYSQVAFRLLIFCPLREAKSGERENMLQPTANLVCEVVFLGSVGIPAETLLLLGVHILRFRYHQI